MLETVLKEAVVAQFQVLSWQLSRKQMQTMTDTFTLAGLIAEESVPHSPIAKFDFPVQQPAKYSSIVTVLTPRCCRLHTNMSLCDATTVHCAAVREAVTGVPTAV